MLWLALYLPNLPLQAFQRGTPETLALAVAERGCVVAANAPAQRLGVHAGMGLAGALALAPGLQARTRAPKLEVALLRDLAVMAGRYTPSVSIDPPASVVVEVAASLRLFGGIGPLMAAAKEECTRLGFVVEMAAAPTPRAARWLARAGHGKVISELAALPAALAELPIDIADCPAATTEMLLAIGTLTLGDCLRLPRAGLARRGASLLLQALAQALGHEADPRSWFSAPAGFASRLEFPVPVSESSHLLFAARRLLAALAGELGTRQAGIEHFLVRLSHEDRADTLLTIRLGAASRDEARFVVLASEHLARLTLTEPALALAVEADDFVPLAGSNASLFADIRRQHEQATQLIERLRARLGEDAVLGIATVSDHRPERAWQTREPGVPTASEAPAGPRPLWLLATPERLASRDDMPCRGTALTLLAGPERIETGWWDDDPAAQVLRDYYIAAGRAGELMWIFRERTAAARWYLHGIFS